MNQKRLIITSLISIILVSVLFIGSTYSVFTTTSPDEEINSYKTGNLDIEVTGADQPIENILPTSIEKSDEINPYRISIKNIGTVPYIFNIILEETTSTNQINHKYIMTKVGVLDPISLEECDNNIIKRNIIILPNETVDVDIRVWISDKIPNTEMKKSFFSKIRIAGEATQKTTKKDNEILINPSKNTTQSEDLQNQNQQSDNKEIKQ